ncbi:DUF3422 family protein [Microvirga pakistanensis]|uniref:DUF3422 family protein n=1 Tax=Microvirga pakistanensis TaxID=1682650 RepID=UPI001FCE4529|nr:DUF3422 domain-containing protein [Microvirga pakistanensis]
MIQNSEPHPLRERVLAEVHARPFSPISTPRRLLHLAYVTNPDAAAVHWGALTELCACCGSPGPTIDAKHLRIEVPEGVLVWESHSEFTTCTWEFTVPDCSAAEPFHPSANFFLRQVRQLPPPGQLLVAVDLHLVPGGDIRASLQEVFGQTQIAASEAEESRALIATDFKPDADGWVRVLTINRGLTPDQAGALVQRVLEIETYRTFALLGLPEAQALAPSIRRIEVELPDLLRQMRESDDFEANHRLLNRITALAAELEAGAAASLYRFGATRAYDELVRLRLNAIGERPASGMQSWSGFLSRRLNPAMRTCASTEERQVNLSRKLARAAQLLRARVDVALEQQNRSLLEAMNERARTQLRLQQTVEGLSVAAITYYVASLAHLLFEGAHAADLHVDPNVATAFTVPFALIGVAWLVRRIRRSHSID